MAPSHTIPAVLEPSVPPLLTRSHSSVESDVSSSSSSSSSSINETNTTGRQRPKLDSRKSSGTIIVDRNDPQIELKDEVYDDDDARAMSPRRTSEDVERIGQEARQCI